MELDLPTNSGWESVFRFDDPVKTCGFENMSVGDILPAKHPVGLPAQPESIIPVTLPELPPFVYYSIDATLIHSTALHTTGAVGSSGLDASTRGKLYTAFKSGSCVRRLHF